MAHAPQWNVKGVDEDVRVVARDAAAAAGLPIGSWIDRAVKRAAAAQPVMPAIVQAVTAPELALATLELPSGAPEPAPAASAPSLIERGVGKSEPPLTDILPEELYPVGPASEAPPDRVPPSAPRGGIGRGVRIGIAFAVMAVVTGGALWLFDDQMRLPAAANKSAAVPQGASSTSAAPMTAAAADPKTPEAAAIETLRQAAQAGDARAQYDLGVRYASGHGVSQDDVQAVRWFERAAVQGMASAQYNLGVMYDRGFGVEEQPTLAFFWYQSAAEQGHPRAQHNLATAYADGRGTTQDFAAAARWFQKAAAAGILESQYYLGAMYERGMGVPKDTARALALYRIAAGQGHKDAAERVAALAAMAPATRPGLTASQIASIAPGGEAVTPRTIIAEIQRLLSRLDFDPGPADGVMGKKTVDAIAKYQAMAGMTTDGKASATLLEELREVASAAKR